MNSDYERLLDINQRLASGQAVVMTVQELKSRLRQGERFELEDVDVITTATHGIMSGTAAAFSIDVGTAGSFRKAKRAWLNGVECEAGPAPNERLGAVDLTTHGTRASADAPKSYSAGHLFRDLVERKMVALEVETDTGSRIKRNLSLDEFGFARIFGTRNALKDYMIFGNFHGAAPIESIFSPLPMSTESGVTAVGSGEVNPLQNDPTMRTIYRGSIAFLNDAPGVVIGEGTRSKPGRPSLSIAADMFTMDPSFMGGVRTPGGMEILNGVAVPIPIMDEAMLRSVCAVLDRALPLPIADVSDRQPFAATTYGEVWEGRDEAVSCDDRKLAGCGPGCRCAAICPTEAIASVPEPRFDKSRCANCGACVAVCTSGAMTGDFGQLSLDGKSYKISYRTSDRRRSADLARRLKHRFYEEGLLLPLPPSRTRR